MIRQLLAVVFVLGLTYLLLQLRHFILTYGKDKRRRYRAYIIWFDNTDGRSGPGHADPKVGAGGTGFELGAAPRRAVKDDEDLSEWPTELDVPAVASVGTGEAPAGDGPERAETPATSQSGDRQLYCLAGTLALGLTLLSFVAKAQAPDALATARDLPEADAHGQAVAGRPPAKIEGGSQDKDSLDAAALLKELQQMRQTIERLEARVAQLEAEKRAANSVPAAPSAPPAAGTVADRASSLDAAEPGTASSATRPAAAKPASTAAEAQAVEDRKVLDFFRDTTISGTIDGYYGYNFNRPVGRINLLRAYDVSSNSFSLNQAVISFERAPHVDAGRRFGLRLDLMYGQATETVQGSAANEPRPQVYRPIWQAYGTYVAPIGKGLQFDFGKFASSLGYETNYTKDDFNYSRSYYFNFLPFYHFGLRAKYPASDKLTVMYHLMNGIQQAEDFNKFKSQHVALILTPTKKIGWQVNYFFGREQRDVAPQLNPTFPSLPTQPGLSTDIIRPVPRGRLHILDTYLTWNVTDRLTLAGEADYVVNRVEEFSAPTRVSGGVAYAHYQFTPKVALNGRAEYLSDRGGLFSGVTQALKETTLTFDYKFAEGFLMRAEWRRDFSNRPFFLTDVPGVLKKEQNTATLGLIWWFGKEGSW